MRTLKFRTIYGLLALIIAVIFIQGCSNKPKKLSSGPSETVKGLIQEVDKFIACPCKPPDSCDCLEPDVSHGHPADDHAIAMIDSVFGQYVRLKNTVTKTIKETEIKLLKPGESDESERDLIELNALMNKLDLFYERLSFKLMIESGYTASKMAK